MTNRYVMTAHRYKSICTKGDIEEVVCHLCRKRIKVGDKVVSRARRAVRKNYMRQYHEECARKVHIID